MKNFFYYWLPVYVYASLIFYFSSLPKIPEPIIEIIPQTLILHIIEYAILSILLFRAFTKSNNTNMRNNAVLLAIMIATLYGITDEIHQYFVPGRISSYLDIIANCIGSTVILIRNTFGVNLTQKTKKFLKSIYMKK
jgi:VanZ family protein